LFEDKETAQHILQLFLNLNDQMEDAILSVEPKTSPEEYKAFKRGVGYVIYEVFEKIIDPICKQHPSLKPPGMDD
jgi:hypothetical protein